MVQTDPLLVATHGYDHINDRMATKICHLVLSAQPDQMEQQISWKKACAFCRCHSSGNHLDFWSRRENVANASTNTSLHLRLLLFYNVKGAKPTAVIFLNKARGYVAAEGEQCRMAQAYTWLLGFIVWLVGQLQPIGRAIREGLTRVVPGPISHCNVPLQAQLGWYRQSAVAIRQVWIPTRNVNLGVVWFMKHIGSRVIGSRNAMISWRYSNHGFGRDSLYISNNLFYYFLWLKFHSSWFIFQSWLERYQGYLAHDFADYHSEFLAYFPLFFNGIEI